MKTECFAFIEKNEEKGIMYPRCNALQEMVCKNKNCPFFKTKEEVPEWESYIEQ